ncbi:MAG: hypothetical protein HYS62_00360 [Candidatus Aenigmarchaeota archaeon]|nr:hypothetical protein [Candidatus Aenigmarchaeota archaeon]
MGTIDRIVYGQTVLPIEADGRTIKVRYFRILPPNISYKGGGDIVYGLYCEDGQLIAEPVGRCYGSGPNYLEVDRNSGSEDRKLVRAYVQDMVKKGTLQLPLLDEIGPVIISRNGHESSSGLENNHPKRDYRQLVLV